MSTITITLKRRETTDERETTERRERRMNANLRLQNQELQEVNQDNQHQTQQVKHDRLFTGPNVPYFSGTTDTETVFAFIMDVEAHFTCFHPAGDQRSEWLPSVRMLLKGDAFHWFQ